MALQNEVISIVNSVMNCNYCRPLSGCIVSDLKGKEKQEIKIHLNELSEKALDRIISYHECCPYRDRLAM